MAKKKKTVARAVNNLDRKTIAFVVIFLILGLAIGALSMFMVIKDDTFKLNGESEIVIGVGGTYTELSAKAIAFGKDISDDVKISGEVNTSKEGEYIIKYTVENFRFKGYTLYRKIVVGGE